MDPHPARPTGPRAEAVAASEAIVGYLGALLDHKRAEPGEDLVTDLVAAARDGALTRQEMLSTIFQLFVAGHDTTTSLIGNATVALLRHPVQRDALVTDPGLATRVVEETMRWDAPVPHSTFRFATEDVPIGDVVIPAYAQVIVSLAAANGTRRATATRRRSTSPAPTAATSHSATASTTASARHWPGWRDASHSPRCTPASPRCGWPPTRTSCIGGARQPGAARAHRAASSTQRLIRARPIRPMSRRSIARLPRRAQQELEDPIGIGPAAEVADDSDRG